MQAGLRPSADEDAGGGANGGRNNANNSTEQRLWPQTPKMIQTDKTNMALPSAIDV
jgi:hypothetical protein